MVTEAKVVILGGGVTGLCAAHLLTQRLGPDSVILAEADSSPGGTARTDKIDGILCDWGPNGFLDREPKTLEWVNALGLQSSTVQANQAASRRYILKDDALREVFPPPKVLISNVLSLRGRARMACEPLIASKKDNAPETVWSFAARRVGKEAADTLVSAMVTGVFGGDAKALSLEHCFPRMRELETEYGGLFRAFIARRFSPSGGSPVEPSGVLTTFKEGMGTLADAAAQGLGEHIQLDWKASKISREGATYVITSETGDQIRAENLVIALPAHAAAPLLTSLDDGLAHTLSTIVYADVAVICSAYRRGQVGHDLEGLGFLAPRNQRKRVLGCIWTSSIFPHTASRDWVLLRTLFGGATDAGAVALSDAQLVACLEKEVHPLLGIDGEPDWIRVYRHRPGIPQYLLNHGDILAALEAAEDRNQGLALAGNAYRGVGLNDCVLSAHRAVKRILPD